MKLGTKVKIGGNPSLTRNEVHGQEGVVIARYAAGKYVRVRLDDDSTHFVPLTAVEKLFTRTVHFHGGPLDGQTRDINCNVVNYVRVPAPEGEIRYGFKGDDYDHAFLIEGE